MRLYSTQAGLLKRKIIMSDISEMWADYRKAQKQRRKDRLPKSQQEIEDLKLAGFEVIKRTEYHYSVIKGTHRIDLYPTHKRYHVLTTNRRGTYRNLESFIKSVIV